MKAFAMTLLATLVMSTAAVAHDHDDERPDHFEGKQANTLEEAVANFSEGNKRLAELLAADELTEQQMGEIHQLSYTLENALGKIDDEVDAMAESLEEVHQGSETMATDKVASEGEAYLNAAQTLVP